MRKERRNIPLADILPNTGQAEWLPANPRQWTAQDINRTARSIKEDTDFLEERPILVFPLDGKHIAFAGNLRREGCLKNKMTTAPCVIYYPENEADQETIKRRAIKDNGQFGSWDFDALANEWDGPLTDWGVPAWDTEQTQGDADATEAQEDDFDETADAVETRCQPGDIWQLGDHRLMCGDSTDAAQVALLMNGEKADLLLTDPPYNVEYVGAKNRMLDHLESRKLKHGEIENDVMSAGDYGDFLSGCFNAAEPNMRAGAAFYVWYASSFHAIVEKAISSAGLLVKQQIIWNKNALVLGWYDYKFKHEPCLYGWKDGAAHYFTDKHDQTTVIDCPRPVKSEYHPTMKPVPLFAQLMENSSREGEIVLDVFGGSGTTLIAAEQLKRRCFMMELDPHYCDIILARWEKLTGQTATKL